jgi:hypothetical protein
VDNYYLFEFIGLFYPRRLSHGCGQAKIDRENQAVGEFCVSYTKVLYWGAMRLFPALLVLY